MYYYTRQTYLRLITITEQRGFITSLSFGNYKNAGKVLPDKKFLTETINQAFSQLEEYLNGKRKEFSLPLNPKGTPFQQKVWSALLTIPYGETRSYKDVAMQIGKPNASRAIGMANHENPIPIFIPCHRVVSSDCTLGGYSGSLDVKMQLLQIENGVVVKK